MTGITHYSKKGEEKMAANTNHLGRVKHGKDVLALNIIAYTFCGLMALICLVPFLMILAGSFSSESAILKNGFSLLPQDFSLEAYKTVFKEPIVVFRAYATTICLTIAGTFLGLALQTMTAYVLARKEFEWRNVFSFFFYFTVQWRTCSLLSVNQTDAASCRLLSGIASAASVQRVQSADYEELYSGHTGISDRCGKD